MSESKKESFISKWRKKDSEIVQALKQIPICADLFRQEFREIEKIIKRKSYKANELIFDESEINLGLYIILDGNIEIYNQSKKKDKLLACLKDGDFFGELTMITEKPSSAAAIAKTDSNVLAFYRSDLLDLLKRKPSTGIKILLNLATMMGKRLRVTNEILNKEKRANK